MKNIYHSTIAGMVMLFSLTTATIHPRQNITPGAISNGQCVEYDHSLFDPKAIVDYVVSCQS